MPAAGTITLTQNSTAVTGNGTAFTTAVAPGGFIVATVGGTAYTLGVLSVQSNTALTISQVYQGPTTAGLSYDYVPMAVLNLITSALAQQVSYAIRGLNLDKDNWQQIFSSSGNVTVTLPDGSKWSGPGWKYIASQFDSLNTQIGNRLEKAKNLSDVADKNAAWSNIAKYGSSSDTAARGDDARLGSIDGKTGGTVSGDFTISSGTFNKYGTATVNRIEGNLLIPSLSQNAITLWNTTPTTQNVWLNWYRAEGLNGWRMGRQDGGSLVLACDQVGNTAMILGVNDKIYSTANTTRASDGTLKAASPVIRIVTSKETSQRADVAETGFSWCGSGTANEEAEGVTITRKETGVYEVAGSAGLATDGWQLAPPRDPQGSGDLGIVEAETSAENVLTVRLYKRRMRLTDEGDIEIVKGALIDVPVNSWIDVRLSMPEDSVFNRKQAEEQQTTEDGREASEISEG